MPIEHKRQLLELIRTIADSSDLIASDIGDSLIDSKEGELRIYFTIRANGVRRAGKDFHDALDRLKGG